MDFFKLSAGPNYTPEDLIEGYDSLIWTERYKEPGDFELKTADIKNMRTLLPVGSLVTHRDTLEACFVESHDVTEQDDGPATLTIKGRSFFSFMEKRIALQAIHSLEVAGALRTWTLASQTSGSAAKYLIDYIARDGTLHANDAIPNLVTTISVNKTMTTSVRAIDRGTLFERVMGILQEDTLGIRFRRPTPPSVTLGLNIYDGEDKTASVIFDANLGHFDSINFLNSNANFITAAYGSTKTYAASFTTSAYVSYTGLQRRVILLDASDVNDAPNESQILTSRIASALRNNKNASIVLDGEVSDDIPYVYNVDYSLGDTVLLRSAKYGVEDVAMVTEYIRIDDQTGDKSYPGLAVLN